MKNLSVREPVDFANRIAGLTGAPGEIARPRENGSNCPFTERRRHPRYAFTAAATVLDPDSGARVEAHTTDLCLGGCYVDAMSALPVGTIVELRLTKEGKSFHSMAKVASSQSGAGFGLAFSAVDHDQFLLLRRWFAELRGERSHEPFSLEEDDTANCEMTEKSELRFAFEELLVQLMRKGILDEEEGEPILRRLIH